MTAIQCIVQAALVGAGATLFMDAWLLLLQRLGIARLNFTPVGRLAGHALEGRFAHDNIAQATAMPHEAALGWLTHYAVGIAFGWMLTALLGSQWLRSPSLWPALGFGVITVLFPFLLMQPAMGQGLAAGRTDSPWRNRLRSGVNHAVFGLGLYLAARLLAPWA